MEKRVQVAAAVIEDGGRILLSSRPAGRELAGLMEFPGGKLEKSESAADALRRELQEELGLTGVHVLDELWRAFYRTPGRILEIIFLRCRLVPGAEMHPCEGQEIKWVLREDVRKEPLPPADYEVAEWLGGFF